MRIQEQFRKRVYSNKDVFLNDFRAFVRALPSFLKAYVFGKLERAFVEKIFVAVSTINSCKYCSWIHLKLGLKSGTNLQDVYNLISLIHDTGNIKDEREAFTIAFASYYVDSRGELDRCIIERFRSMYPPDMAKAIISCIQVINFANLVANTFEEFLDYLLKRRRSRNMWLKFAIFLLSSPICLPLSLILKMNKSEIDPSSGI